ncbi:hypothetical protein KIH79_05450 [Bifidobacterium sp. 82T10]|uniref:Uncharacterized protein n=1 Tax=Bifidobacterium miconis TaxID=2834435 RepID=A0ABS6WEC0_9BIFI|nr:CAP domain-containing protein [Bifidobacterium miconis]MBW3092396.1 hypothetical protein [Bifidobacterium miconis]
MAQHSSGVLKHDRDFDASIVMRTATVGVASLVAVATMTPGAIAAETNPSPAVTAVAEAGDDLAQAQAALAAAKKTVAEKQAVLDAAKKLTAGDFKDDADVKAASDALAKAEAEQQSAETAVADAQKAYDAKIKELGIDPQQLAAAQKAVTDAKATYEKAQALADVKGEASDAKAGEVAVLEQVRQDAEKKLADATARTEEAKRDADEAEAAATKAGATAEAIAVAQKKFLELKAVAKTAQDAADKASAEKRAAQKVASDAKAAADKVAGELAALQKQHEDAVAKVTASKQALDAAKAYESLAMLKQAYEQAQKDYAAKQTVAGNAKTAAASAQKTADEAKTAAENAQKTADAATAAIADKKKAADVAQAQLDKGLFGFLDENGSEAAKNIMNNDKTFQQWVKDGWISNGEHSSFNLESVRKSLSYIDYFNQIRKDNNLPELKVSDYLMFTSSADNEAIQHNGFDHPAVQGWNASENIAYGPASEFWTPFTGWYDDEKKIFDEEATKNPALEEHRNDALWIYQNYPDLYHTVGHYLNIVDASATVTGYGTGRHEGDPNLNAQYSTQNFMGEYWNEHLSFGPTKTYTTKEFANAINKWEQSKKDTVAAYSIAKADADKAQAEAKSLAETATQKQQAADEAVAAQKSAEQAVADQLKVVESAKKAYEDAANGKPVDPPSPEEIAKLQKAYDDAVATEAKLAGEVKAKSDESTKLNDTATAANKTLAEKTTAYTAADKAWRSADYASNAAQNKLMPLMNLRNEADLMTSVYQSAVGVEEKARSNAKLAGDAWSAANDLLTALRKEQALLQTDADAKKLVWQKADEAYSKLVDASGDIQNLKKALDAANAKLEAAKQGQQSAQKALDDLVAKKVSEAVAKAEADLKAAVKAEEEAQKKVDELTPSTPDPTPTPTPDPEPSPEPEPMPQVESQDVYRLYNARTGEHFYTANSVERDVLSARGWTYEGVGFKAAKKTGVEVKRYYRAGGKHMFTTSKAEQAALVKAGWTYEGVAFLAPEDKDGTNDVYRLYNAKNGDHLFTVSAAEQTTLAQRGWNDEGIGYLAVK